MKTIKNAPTAFRFDTTVKTALALLADKEGRSMANMLEWLIRKQCEREGLGWPPAIEGTEAPAPARGGKASAKPARKRAAVASTNKN
jgi:hypothetical protein